MINKTLVSILAQMRSLASELKEYGAVLSMPGVGNILGPRLIAEIGDGRRLHSGSALLRTPAWMPFHSSPEHLQELTGIM